MLIGADASQLEWRGILECSEDPVGFQEVLDGIDFHTLNQKEFNLPDRLTAKLYLFRTIFNRGKGYAFTQDPSFMHVSTSVKFWDEVGHKFYTKYKYIDKLYDTNLQLISQGKPIVGPLGREWEIKLFKNYKGEMELPVTKAVNYPVQGTGADVMMLARISLRNRLRKLPESHYIKFISTVHDSIVLDAPSEFKAPITQTFHAVFADLPKNIEKVFGYKWKTPLACEVKAGPNMKDMEKL
jgi:DNA polymerase-1